MALSNPNYILFFLMIIIIGVFELKEYYNKNLYLTVVTVILVVMWSVSYIQALSPGVNELIYLETGLLTVLTIVVVSILVKRGEAFGKLMESYDEILARNPNDITALNNKGVGLVGQMRYEKAMKCFDKALEIDPEDTTVIYNKNFMNKHIPYRTVADKLEKRKFKINENAGKLILEPKETSGISNEDVSK